MGGTVTDMGSRVEGHFRVDRYKLAHTTGGLTFTAEPLPTIKRIVLDDSGTTVTFGDNTEYVLETETDPSYSTFSISSQADNSTRFVELWYGAQQNVDPPTF
jgi:hypothetical protein